MALLSVAFDSGWKLKMANYFFNYEGCDFRVIRGTKEEKDEIWAILKDRKDLRNPIDENEYFEVMSKIGRLFSLIAWSHRVPIEEGCNFIDGGIVSLEKIHRKIIEKRKTPVSQSHEFFDYIPKVTNSRQQLALAWFREAIIANSNYYKAFNFYKIIETERFFRRNPDDWIDKNLKFVSLGKITEICPPKNLRSFFKNECRNAIAHIARRPYANPDDARNHYRITVAHYVLDQLATRYIEKVLKVARYGQVPLSPSQKTK